MPLYAFFRFFFDDDPNMPNYTQTYLQLPLMPRSKTAGSQENCCPQC